MWGPPVPRASLTERSSSLSASGSSGCSCRPDTAQREAESGEQCRRAGGQECVHRRDGTTLSWTLALAGICSPWPGEALTARSEGSEPGLGERRRSDRLHRFGPRKLPNPATEPAAEPQGEAGPGAVAASGTEHSSTRHEFHDMQEARGLGPCRGAEPGPPLSPRAAEAAPHTELWATLRVCSKNQRKHV